MTTRPGSNRQPSKNAARKHHRVKGDSPMNVREEAAKNRPEQVAADARSKGARVRGH
jgi:hypothetical protein